MDPSSNEGLIWRGKTDLFPSPPTDGINSGKSETVFHYGNTHFNGSRLYYFRNNTSRKSKSIFSLIKTQINTNDVFITPGGRSIAFQVNDNH